MQIWKLQAIDPDDPSWRTHDYKGPFIVSAESEDRARRKVERQTLQFVPLIPGSKTIFSPWIDRDKTVCEPCSDSGFSSDGPEEILSPTDDRYR
jgi:hypothetical protein